MDKIFLPIVKSIARTISQDLVSVTPMGGNNIDEINEIKKEVDVINRERKIDNIVDNKAYEEMKIEEHPDFKPGPKADIFYLDFQYGNTQSTQPSRPGPI